MFAFWDTSAVVPLVLQERGSRSAQECFSRSDGDYAWSWMRVEAEAALLRRCAPVRAWESLDELLGGFRWVELPAGELPELRKFNVRLALRASDAGHLYCFVQSLTVQSDLVLVSFNDELLAAARKKRLRVWPTS